MSPNHAIRKTKVLLRKPWKNFELARGMNPLKYFYDLTLGKSNYDLTLVSQSAKDVPVRYLSKLKL